MANVHAAEDDLRTLTVSPEPLNCSGVRHRRHVTVGRVVGFPGTSMRYPGGYHKCPGGAFQLTRIFRIRLEFVKVSQNTENHLHDFR